MQNKISIKEINKLAIPAILGLISEPIIGMTDTYVAGHFKEDSDIAQSAIGLGSNYYVILVWSLAQLRTASSALVAKYYGAKSMKRIYTLIPQAMFLMLVLGLFFASISYIFSGGIFINLFDIDTSNQKLLNTTFDYFNIRIWSLPLSLITLLIFGIFRGMQNTHWAMMISLIGVGINVSLDFLLAYGYQDFIPAMETKGIAIASLIAEIVMCGIAITLYLKRTPFKFNLIKHPSPFMREMLIMFVNMLIRTLALNATFFLANRLIAPTGKENLAAHSILVSIWLFSAYFIDGYSTAGNAIAGKLKGEKDNKTIYNLGIKLCKINIGIGIVLSLVYLLGYNFISHFYTNKAEVSLIIKDFLWILIITQPFNAIAFTMDGLFKGLGETTYLRDTLLIGTLIFIPIAYAFDFFNLTFFGVWLGFLIWMVYRGGSLMYIFYKNFRT